MSSAGKSTAATAAADPAAADGTESWASDPPLDRSHEQTWRARLTAGNPYADESGAFGDNVFRFSLLSMAACEAPLILPIGGFR